MCIIPVRIKYENNDKHITKYAMLNNCSKFAHEAVLKQLSVKGIKTTLSLKTLHGERSENTGEISGIQVKGMNGDRSWLRLPRLYTRKDLRVDTEETATPEKITEWKYLKPIATDLVKSDEVWVELLIGANCVKALEKIHAIASEDGDTYAFRTRPGMVYNKNNNNCYCKCPISCHWVAVTNASTSPVAYHFGI